MYLYLMGDVLTKEQRSYNMSQIKSKHTKAELALRKALSSRGIRGYRLHSKIIGKPDIVFTNKKVAIFIDGCFWHKCPRCFIKPQTRKEFWNKKIEGNVQRDKIINVELKKGGWKVLRFWEHEVKKDLEKCIKKIINAIQNEK